MIKFAFFIAALIVVSNQPVVFEKNTEKTYYYFCDSKPWNPSAVAGKKTIFHTDVIEITCDESHIRLLAGEWGKMVEKQCKNTGGCSSDLNYYTTKEAARSRLQDLKTKYADVAEYVIEKLAFNPEVSK